MKMPNVNESFRKEYNLLASRLAYNLPDRFIPKTDYCLFNNLIPKYVTELFMLDANIIINNAIETYGDRIEELVEDPNAKNKNQQIEEYEILIMKAEHYKTSLKNICNKYISDRTMDLNRIMTLLDNCDYTNPGVDLEDLIRRFNYNSTDIIEYLNSIKEE